ncbi:hypothetical protein IMZ48_35070 [Candidatus Bathyarchaeota archaeon]|nr:hypothetical protein [Candidatus Bathyarchaeota archaeon]
MEEYELGDYVDVRARRERRDREARQLDKRREKRRRLDERDEMKFSHSIQFNAVPDWSSQYLAYSNLKKLCVVPVVLTQWQRLQYHGPLIANTQTASTSSKRPPTSSPPAMPSPGPSSASRTPRTSSGAPSTPSSTKSPTSTAPRSPS